MTAETKQADSVVGSPDYMPPEVLRAKTYTYSADYWSLGCILFEFLCVRVIELAKLGPHV